MDSAIKAANERQAYVTQDEEARRVYWSRRKAEHDRISGLDHARQEGVQEVARNLVASGEAIEIISKTTGLSPVEIAKL